MLPPQQPLPIRPWALAWPRMAGLLLIVSGWLPLTAADDFQALVVGGWQVRLDQGCQAGAPADRAAFDAVLAEQIARLGRLPEPAHESLRQAVRIYVSSGTHRRFGAQHHPSPAWLAQNGYPAEFAGHVEICDWREFTGLVRSQPFCLLHEMAHAFHSLTPAADAPIRAAYDHAKSAGLYRQVTRGHGQAQVEAYALTNHREYFSELSEAYFGENDFAPYDRAELAAYDPEGLRMLVQVWGAQAGSANP